MNTENSSEQFVGDVDPYKQDPTIPNRLTTLLNNERATEHDKKFLSSLRDYYMKYKRLTNNQYAAMVKTEDRYSPEKIALNEEWYKNFDSEKKKIFKLCCKYYMNTAYFNDLAIKGMKDEFIPSEKQYRAMCENKYAKRLVENMLSPPKFPVGTIVQQRKIKDSYVGSITAVSDTVTRYSANIGARMYTVMWMNDGSETTATEKNLKIYRMGKG